MVNNFFPFGNIFFLQVDTHSGSHFFPIIVGVYLCTTPKISDPWERERIVRATQAVERKTCIHFRIINSGYLPNHLEANRPLQFHNSINIYLVPSICLTLIHNWIICNPSTQKLNLVGEIYEYIKKYTYSILTKTFDSKNGKKVIYGWLEESWEYGTFGLPLTVGEGCPSILGAQWSPLWGSCL